MQGTISKNDNLGKQTKEVKAQIVPNYHRGEQCTTTNTASLEDILSPTNFPPVINVQKTPTFLSPMDHKHKSPYPEDVCSPCAPDTVSIPYFHDQDSTFSWLHKEVKAIRNERKSKCL